MVKEKNTADGRRQLYTLAPDATARSTAAGGREIDFGPCEVRL